MKITTDLIVGTGLVTALLATILCGVSPELQQTLGSGLIGYLGRTAMEHSVIEHSTGHSNNNNGGANN